MTVPKSPLTQLTLTFALSLALLAGGAGPALGAHDSGCDERKNHVEQCDGGWKTPLLGNPAWWETDAPDETDNIYQHKAGGNNRPAWFKITTAGGSADPFEVSVEVSGNTVGSLDVFRFRSGASDDITPSCPQGLVTELYPQRGEAFGSAGHLSYVRHVTLEHHRTILPAPLTANWTPGITVKEAYVELNRTEDWVVVVDIRGGTDATDGVATVDGKVSRIDYDIRVADGQFDTEAISPPPRPLDVNQWVLGADQCLSAPPLPN